ncbi:MAG: hypothetical protein GX801_06015 [Fibrobacter sp.]|nr:hypothetical protein [Fibrobacter sp.]
MISVVICSVESSAADLVRRNAMRTAGTLAKPFTDMEFIIIDNNQDPRGICAVYNEGARRAQGDILLFMHEDVFFMDFNWGNILEEKFANNPELGVLGLAGSQILNATPPFWPWFGDPYLAGRIVHEINDGKDFFIMPYGADNNDKRVLVADGLWLAVRRQAWEKHPFDEETFKNFHFYDLDLCMQMYPQYQVVVSSEILVKHLSQGSFGPVWEQEAELFLEKWGHKLPLSVPGISIPQQRGPMPVSVNIKGQISQQTIV